MLLFSSHRALIRPGRFDSRIDIPLPDVKARFEILKVHAKKVKMSQGNSNTLWCKSYTLYVQCCLLDSFQNET